MKYYLDTEFIEGIQKQSTLSKLFGKSKPTIDLISIGIVSQEGKEYYAISKDFNLKEAWNRYQMKQVSGDARNRYPEGIKEYWIRENVLKPIFQEFIEKEYEARNKQERILGYSDTTNRDFTYKNFKALINKYGKSNAQIAEEIKVFCYNGYWLDPKEVNSEYRSLKDCVNIEFYAYYADYDWVAFCWLFRKMTDLPEGFPMYCIDLKQILDDYVTKFRNQRIGSEKESVNFASWETYLKSVKNNPGYPKQINEHNALGDAKWNKKLHEFLNSL
jgi:hypothetical protein